MDELKTVTMGDGLLRY